MKTALPLFDARMAEGQEAEKQATLPQATLSQALPSYEMAIVRGNSVLCRQPSRDADTLVVGNVRFDFLSSQQCLAAHVLIECLLNALQMIQNRGELVRCYSNQACLKG